MTDRLTFCFESTYCGGWPRLVFSIDDQICLEHQIDHCKETVDLAVDLSAGTHQLRITKISSSASDEQLVILEDILLNDVRLPFFVKHSGVFAFGHEQHAGSVWWQPNGSWVLDLESPLTDWIIATKRRKENSVSDLLSFQDRQTLSKDLARFAKELENHG